MGKKKSQFEQHDNYTYWHKLPHEEDMEAPRSLLIIYTFSKMQLPKLCSKSNVLLQEDRMMLCSTDVSLKRIPGWWHGGENRYLDTDEKNPEDFMLFNWSHFQKGYHSNLAQHINRFFRILQSGSQNTLWGLGLALMRAWCISEEHSSLLLRTQTCT